MSAWSYLAKQSTNNFNRMCVSLYVKLGFRKYTQHTIALCVLFIFSIKLEDTGDGVRASGRAHARMHQQTKCGTRGARGCRRDRNQLFGMEYDSGRRFRTMAGNCINNVNRTFFCFSF